MSSKTAIAALNFALTLGDDGSVPMSAHILPPGPFGSKDGRPEEVMAWQLDETIAARLIEKIRSRKTKTVIDYEHQTLFKELNGKPAPAAGWFWDMEWRESGLFAVGIKWTQRAAAMIEAKEYLYTSAVFSYNKKTGEILDILSFALTNTPALDELDSVVALSRLGGLTEEFYQEKTMEETDKSIASLTARVAVLVEEAKQKDEDVAALTEQVASLKKQLADIDAEKAAAAAEAEEKEKAGIIEAALTCKQILPADREILAEMALSQVRKFIDARKGVEFLTRQTSDGRPDEDITHGLTDEELAMCNQVGLSKEEYALAKKAIGL